MVVEKDLRVTIDLYTLEENFFTGAAFYRW